MTSWRINREWSISTTYRLRSYQDWSELLCGAFLSNVFFIESQLEICDTSRHHFRTEICQFSTLNLCALCVCWRWFNAMKFRALCAHAIPSSLITSSVTRRDGDACLSYEWCNWNTSRNWKTHSSRSIVGGWKPCGFTSAQTSYTCHVSCFAEDRRACGSPAEILMASKTWRTTRSW